MIIDLLYYIIILLAMYYCMDISKNDFIKIMIISLCVCLFIMEIDIQSIIKDIILLEAISFMFYYYLDKNITEVLFYSSFLLLLKNVVTIISFEKIICIIIFVVIIFIMMYIKKMFPIQDHNMYWGLLAAISLSTFVIYHILYNDFLDVLGVNRNIIILLTLFMTICISYYLFLRYTLLNHEQKLIEQAIEHFKNDKQQYTYIEKKNKELYQLRHDLKYDYLQIKQYIKNQQFENIDYIIDNKLDYLNKDYNIITSGNKLLDSFINMKLDLAKQQHIQTTIVISIHDLSFINDNHLNIFISYIFDLAMQSCTAIDKMMNIKIIQDISAFEIIIDIPNGRNHHLDKTKIETLHILLKKYDGCLLLESLDNEFHISLLIPVI